MTHLSEAECVDLLENTLPVSRAAHVDSCKACAAMVDTLRDAVERVAEVDVPDPSPLFWEHFSTRVRSAVGEAAPGESSRWPALVHSAGVRWVLAGALVAVFVVAGLWRPGRSIPLRSANEAMTIATSEPYGAVDALDTFEDGAADNDAAWALVQSVADDVPWNDHLETSLDTRPGGVDRAALALKGQARAELIRLLEAETKRPGA
jgi:hypothetical protein